MLELLYAFLLLSAGFVLGWVACALLVGQRS